MKAVDSVPPLPLAVPPPAELLEENDGFSGLWLRGPRLEAFVALRPVFRVLDVRRPGRASLLAGRGVAEQGLRLAFMEPEQIPASFDVGNQAAELVAFSAEAGAVRVRLAAAGGLRYSASVRLDADEPRLHLEYVLENVGALPRRVACWSVLSFARGAGSIVAPFARAEAARRRLVLPWWSAWPQPGVRFGRDAVLADTAARLHGEAYKLGLISDAGWIAFVHGREALVDHAVFDPQALYPEDGANVTFFEGQLGARAWCEIEQVGPLELIHPGERSVLRHSLQLISLDSASLAEPDALRRELEARSSGLR